jgi:hypothetical protein
MTKPIINSFSSLASLMVQQYERYLPTAFDDSLSILEKVNMIINKLDEIGKLSNDLVTQWNAVMEWVMGEGLTEGIKEKLDSMVADGTFNDLINSEIFGEFNTRLNDLAVNVVSFASPSEAVSFAYANNRKLDWGNGTTVVNESIPNLHDVESIGLGKIQRGSDIYYVNPVDVQENKIYVSSSIGNDLNDGLTTTTAVRTIQQALNIVSKHAKGILKGKWRIMIATGTYSHSSLENDILSENPIVIEGSDVGGHPNVPSTIISDGAGFSSYGIWIAGRVELVVKNIKITGYNGTSSSAGIYMSDSGSLTTQNVHTYGNYWGISGQRSSVECPDGIHENNGYLPNGTGNGGAVRSLQLNQHHVGIQNAGVRTNTAIFRNNKTGVFIQENSTGHVDWCTFTGNEDAILVNVNARANMDGCSFDNNVRAVRLIGNAHGFIPSNCVFTNNQANVIRTSGGQVNTASFFDNIDVSYQTDDGNIYTSYVNKDISNVVSEPFFTTYLKAPFWNNLVNSLSPIKKLEIKIFGTIVNNTGVEGSGTKQINMRLGSYKATVTIAITEQGDFYYTGYIYFVNPTTQYLLLEGNSHNNTKRVNRATANNPTTADMKLTIEAQTNQVLDKVHIDVVEIKMAG